MKFPARLGNLGTPQWLALAWLLVVAAIGWHQWQFWQAPRLDTDVFALLPQDEKAPVAQRAMPRRSIACATTPSPCWPWPAYARLWRPRSTALAPAASPWWWAPAPRACPRARPRANCMNYGQRNGEPVIHPFYNTWVGELKESIRGEMLKL